VKHPTRSTVIATIIAALFAALAAPAIGQQEQSPRVEILDAGMVNGHILRVEIATSGLDPRAAEIPSVDLEAWLDGVPARGSLLLIHMPRRFAMDIDLPGGAIRVGVVKVAEFAPIQPFTDNVRFPIRVTLREDGRVATASQIVTVLLPTVIVPGYMNELSGRSKETLEAFIHRGHRDNGRAPTVFWFEYPSRSVTLEEGAHRLADYIRHVVLAQTYAAKINVVGYSFGGLMARWNVQFDVDGWGTLVNRLILIGVPNEGSVLAYAYRNIPAFLPFAYFAHSPAVNDMTPTFPFWRAAPTKPWDIPPDGGNPMLAQLNARPIPEGIRVWVFYASGQPGDANTMAGVTASPQSGDRAAGDGIVLAASAEGLPIHGGSGVAALLAPNVVHVGLGRVEHRVLLASGADRLAAVVLDRFLEARSVTSPRPVPLIRAGNLRIAAGRLILRESPIRMVGIRQPDR
jgi:Lipase (class 2)